MQQLTVEMLKQAGAFAPAKPERREIKWINDSQEIIEAVIHVRKSSFITMIEESKSVADSSYLMATRIASSVVDEQGKPVFTVDDLLGNEERGPICQSLAIALLNAIYDVNGVGKKADPKPSSQPTNSGTNLSLPASVGKRLKKRKTRSLTAKSSTGNPTDSSTDLSPSSEE
ncbi:phage tail assembly chaperone family protein, TAC [Vibrio mimicus]|nr:phage tail assembly chaperone family protein, TAC [Vibrio cholerae]EKF9668191.1 phage tail assembly chaperone family protein, TAC [Vibrio cholerae]